MMSAVSTPRIAIIGAGLIGRKHVDVVRRMAHLDAIIDPDVSTREIADANDTRWHHDAAAYLADHQPDGIIIASPNPLHLPHGQLCIEANIPVLIEKPLADSYADAVALSRLSDETGVPVLVGHHRRHSPIVKAVKSAIERGELGQIAAVNAQFWLYKPDDYFDVVWRCEEGGGPTYINLIHDIDLLRHFCGDIVGVQAIRSSNIRNHAVEDTAAVLLEFENGALGTVSISDTVVAPWSWELTSGENPVYPKTSMACYTLGGTEASLSVPDLSIWRHREEKSWWSPIEQTRLDVEHADPIEEQFQHFLRVISGNEAPLVPASEGAKTIQVLDAIKNAGLHGMTQRIGSSNPMSID